MFQIFQGLKIGSAILKKLQSSDNRTELVTTLLDVLGDCNCTKKEWTELGTLLGVFDSAGG